MTKIEDILKHGKKFKVQKLDPDDPEFKKMLQAVQKEQKKCLERKKITRKTLDLTIDI